MSKLAWPSIETPAQINFRQLIYAMHTCAAHGIDPDLVSAVWLRANAGLMEKLCNQLILALKRTLEATREHRVGRTSKTPVRDRREIPKSVVALLSWKMVELCATLHRPPPQALAELLRRSHGADRIGAAELKGFAARRKAARFLINNPEAKNTAVAKYAGVSPAAITHWRNDGSLERFIDITRVTDHFVSQWNKAASHLDLNAMNRAERALTLAVAKRKP